MRVLPLKNKVVNGYCFKVHDSSYKDVGCMCYELSEWKEIKALVVNLVIWTLQAINFYDVRYMCRSVLWKRESIIIIFISITSLFTLNTIYSDYVFYYVRRITY